MINSDLDDLAAELSDFAAPEKKGGRPPQEERIIAGFEEIQRFVDEHKRLPQHGEDKDIFERLYAVRIDRLRSLPDCRALLAPLDHQKLLDAAPSTSGVEDPIDLDELAAELSDTSSTEDVSILRHVRTNAEKRAAEEIAKRKPCEDFDTFKPLFEKAKRELKDGLRETRAFHQLDEINLAEIRQSEFYIVGGQLAYIAEVGEEIRTKYERRDSRLRVIFDNGTESDVLQRSFQRALYRDESARLVTNPSVGPLFDDEASDNDQESGTIYVLRSHSDNPTVIANREVLHKIGVTGQSNINNRIKNAKNDATFLLGDVEVVATYSLFNINRIKIENLIHRVFESARLDIEIKDRFGKKVVPREWFLVPIFVIDEVVERIKDGSITQYTYDPNIAKLIKNI